MSELFFGLLEREGVPTHFVRRLSDREMLTRRLEIIPCETVVQNVVAGSLAKRLGRTEGEELKSPFVEFYYKSDPLSDPLILSRACDSRSDGERGRHQTIRAMALKVNEVLRRFLDERGVVLSISNSSSPSSWKDLLGDEICPDHVQVLGQDDSAEARQGSIPPRLGWRRRGIPRDAAGG